MCEPFPFLEFADFKFGQYSIRSEKEEKISESLEARARNRFSKKLQRSDFARGLGFNESRFVGFS